MTRFKRPAAAAGAAALLAFSLSACGGGASDAPTDASKDEFCGAWNDAFEPLATAEEEPSEKQFEEFQDGMDDLVDVGTPEGTPDDAREGFEIFVDAVKDASYDDFKEGGDDLPNVSEDDSAKAEAFIEYAVGECTEIPDMDDLPSDAPTE